MRAKWSHGILVCTVVAGACGWTAWSQSYADSTVGGPPTEARVSPAPTAASGLNDMLQVRREPVTSAPRPAVHDCEQTSSPLPASISLAQRLRAWDDATRVNAQLQIELPEHAPASTVALAGEIESLWDAGYFDWAIAPLQELEASGTPVALSVSWRSPQPVGAGRAVDDVRIGARTGGVSSGLDYDAASGKLFAVIRWDTDNGWALYQSTDDGASWTEAYFWSAGTGQHAVDVDLAVVSNYVYVGYIASDSGSEARLRRIVASTGLVDNTYGFHVVLDGGANTFTDVAVASNADFTDNRIYYAARQSNDAVRFAWDVGTDGTTFTEVSPAAAAATGGLDLSWNQGYATYYVWMSYIGTDSRVHALRLSSAGWDEATTAPFDGSHNRSSISAWDDHVICAHELQMDDGQGIRYFITHDGGETWDFYNYIAEPQAGEGPYQMAEVTARGGAGTAIVFTQETGEPDDVLVRYRRGYAPGLWHDEIRVNSNDVSTGTWTALNWAPRATDLSYGLIYFYGTTPYFHSFARCPGDCNCDGRVGFLDIDFFVAAIPNLEAHWASKFPPPGPTCPFENCDVNGNGNVGFDDIDPFVALIPSDCP